MSPYNILHRPHSDENLLKVGSITRGSLLVVHIKLDFSIGRVYIHEFTVELYSSVLMHGDYFRNVVFWGRELIFLAFMDGACVLLFYKVEIT